MTTQSKKPKGTIPLQDLEVRVLSDDKKRPVSVSHLHVTRLHIDDAMQFCFEIICVDNAGNIKAAKTDRQGRYVQGRLTRVMV